MDLPWKAHFCITCSCGKALAFELETKEQYDLADKDPTLFLRSMEKEDQQAAAEFYVEHQKLGHEPAPQLIGVAPLPKA